jgi:hypothetical protein
MLALIVALALSAAPGADSAGAVVPSEGFRALFEEGERLYKQGEYGQAAFTFRRADSLVETPEVAYDLGKCHERMGDVAHALYYFRLYLRRAPRAGDALEIAERVSTLLVQVEKSGRGLLEVEAHAPGTLWVSGTELPGFPAAILLPPGEHELVATSGAAFRSGPSPCAPERRPR